MKSLFGASLTAALVAAATTSALAGDLPEVKITASNEVPACATPGRLMAYLRLRNPKANPRFESVATEYMRHGEELGLRWDIAFFQMILETGALGFGGDVRADQNNFAGLGASGGGAHGERFKDISSGVKAHLQHLMMYAGDHIDNPVAERTRKVQEWGVLTDWQKTISGPMTFTLVAKQWAPTSRNYVRDLSTISNEFYQKVCNGPDPHPEYVQEARAGREPKADTQTAAAAAPAAEQQVATASEPPKESGADIARRNIAAERAEDAPRAGLGAASMLADAAKPAAEQQASKAEAPPAVTILNPSAAPDAKKTEPATTTAGTTKAGTPKTNTPKAEAPKTSVAKADTAAPAKADTSKSGLVKADASPGGAEIQTASVAGAATQLKTPGAKSAKCKVWTASYGGQRAILIKAVTDGTTNYTVLDVNDTTEKREIDAYISAYAKGGENVGAFPSQTKALDKAFELCPEG
jgi:hypothetical protein